MKLHPGRTAAVTAAVVVALLVAGLVYLLSSRDVATRASAGANGSPAPSLSAGPTSPAPTSPSTTPSSAPPLPTSSPTIVAVPPSTPTPTPTPSPTPTPTPTPTPEPPPTLDFVLSSFNVLGASHTTGSGSKGSRFASGRVRAAGAASLIRRHEADVIGFQELQTSQLAALRRTTDLDFYPGTSLGRLDSENSLGWRRDLFTAVERRVVRIPYFDGGLRAMPVVKLRSTSTGLEAWFVNVHNPANTARFHRQQRFRTQATQIEVALTNTLLRTGLPVFLTGDMNERAAFFCRYTSGSPMQAARGGSNTGRCVVGKPRAVDWILGSPDVTFSDYQEDRSHLVDITTDHPVISSRVHIIGNADDQ